VTGHSELGLRQCYISVGLSLGEFDAGRVRDLGLPTIGIFSRASGARRAQPWGASARSVSSRILRGALPPNSSLGALPVVPARTVRRILHGDFVDMAELSEEHLELELRRSLEGEGGKPLPASKLRFVPDLLPWARVFCHFAGIVVQAHPDNAVDLKAYLAIMLSGSDKGD